MVTWLVVVASEEPELGEVFVDEELEERVDEPVELAPLVVD